IEPRDHLALTDDGIEVGAEPGDVARHLAADLHGRHRLQCPRGADGVDDVAAYDRRGIHCHLGAFVLDVVGTGACADDADNGEDADYAFHESVLERYSATTVVVPAAVGLRIVTFKLASVVCCRRAG